MPVEAIITPVFRLSYPTVFKPRRASEDSDKEEFSIVMLFIDQTPYLPKDPATGALVCPKGMTPERFEQFKKDYAEDPTLLIQIRRNIREACVGMWGADQTKWPAGPLKTADFRTYVADIESRKFPIKNGDAKGKPEFAGLLFARAKANADRKPGVVARDGRTHIMEPSQVFGGLLARAHINAYAWTNKKGGSGVSLGLNHLQIIADDGVRFGGGVSIENAGFGAYEGPEDDPSAYDAPGGSSGVQEASGDAF